MAKMQEDQLRAITDGEMRAAVGYWSGKLAMQRQKAMMYYLGKATGDLSPPEVEGRSSVVSPDVRNTIESMMPQLMVKFAGGENVVEFQATKPGQEKMAEQATDYINHLYHVTNNGELISYSWMKDALLSKNGIVKVWWDDRSEETREEYKGLSEVELAMIAGRWLQHARRPNQGVVVLGKVIDLHAQGPWTEYTIETPLGDSSAVSKVLMEGVPFKSGSDVAVVGTIVADPRQAIDGYAGEAQQVIVSGFAFVPEDFVAPKIGGLSGEAGDLFSLGE